MSNSESVQERETKATETSGGPVKPENPETPGTPGASRAQEMLMEFLREHDAAPPHADSPVCPVCGYSLKGLTRPFCPECGQELVLTVGARRLHLGWLLAALAPGFFSGIAAAFVLVPIVLRYVLGDGKFSMILNGMDLFGWCSGAFAIMLARKRTRFLSQPRAKQRMWALTIWFIHIAALGMVILLAWTYG